MFPGTEGVALNAGFRAGAISERRRDRDHVSQGRSRDRSRRRAAAHPPRARAGPAPHAGDLEHEVDLPLPSASTPARSMLFAKASAAAARAAIRHGGQRPGAKRPVRAPRQADHLGERGHARWRRRRSVIALDLVLLERVAARRVVLPARRRAAARSASSVDRSRRRSKLAKPGRRLGTERTSWCGTSTAVRHTGVSRERSGSVAGSHGEGGMNSPVRARRSTARGRARPGVGLAGHRHLPRVALRSSRQAA